MSDFLLTLDDAISKVADASTQDFLDKQREDARRLVTEVDTQRSQARLRRVEEVIVERLSLGRKIPEVEVAELESALHKAESICSKQGDRSEINGAIESARSCSQRDTYIQ